VAGGASSMKIVCMPLFTQQLKTVLASMVRTNPQGAKSFKLYLDTILLNIPSKAQKYKPSIYFDNENVRDIEHQGYTIPFYYDKDQKKYVILGIIDNRE
jgi:hypothetical protein